MTLRRATLAAVKLIHTVAWFSIESCMTYVLADQRQRSIKAPALTAGKLPASRRAAIGETDKAERLIDRARPRVVAGGTATRIPRPSIQAQAHTPARQHRCGRAIYSRRDRGLPRVRKPRQRSDAGAPRGSPPCSSFRPRSDRGTRTPPRDGPPRRSPPRPQPARNTSAARAPRPPGWPSPLPLQSSSARERSARGGRVNHPRRRYSPAEIHPLILPPQQNQEEQRTRHGRRLHFVSQVIRRKEQS